mmetsp:Transcript_44929/g.103855  ORF Transcript_44929/g.103855 Transcript_44929/m.103855 type:complete len:523 (-) Transcript_44929:217-1785(-)
MGASLPKPVEATVIERHKSKFFQVGVAEMNGWRTNMEDAHLVFSRDDWGVFGVFDGHGGAACSKFVAEKFAEDLESNGCPKDDAAVKRLFLTIDKEFLDSEQPSGSTATMCIVRQPEMPGGKHRLHVVNAGDSRVLLGRRDGSIVDGGGTDQGLTTDHKPDHPAERERIERCGGRVEKTEGNVARVNGNLAVSRGFGDKDEKKTGGPGPEDHPVTANPETGRFECDQTDFLLLVCDGVSEGNFPNPEVVELVAKLLREGKDLGETARAVCHKAVERDSKDNITCMLVLLSGTSAPAEKTVEFVPGPITKLGHKGFQEAYSAMAAKAGLSLAKAAAMRYDMIQAELKVAPTAELKEEASKIGTPSGVEGSEERTQWFERWLQNLPEEKDDGPGGMDMDMLQQMMGKGSGKGSGKGAKGSTSAEKSGSEDVMEKDEGGYTWSQKGDEVQVVFKLPKSAAKRDVKVVFKPSSLSVSAHGTSLLDGALGGQVDTDECTWCIAGGGTELQVMLTKKNGDESWKALLR